MISTIIQITLAQPDTSRRRNRSPKTVISNQNHSTKINMDKTSARKLGKVKPPGNNMSILPISVSAMLECPATVRNSTPGFSRRCPNSGQRRPQCLLLGLVERAAHDRGASAMQRGEHLVGGHLAD